MSYTAYVWHTLRKHGIKRALRVVWLMESFGIIRARMIALGIALTLTGIFLARAHGIEIGFLLAMVGTFIVGYNDGRMCVCDCECDDPRMIFDTDGGTIPEYSPADEDVQVFETHPDGTVITPHDRRYWP